MDWGIASHGGSSSTAEPRVYLGSAWVRAMRDLATKPAEWSTARASAGYFLHPMGFKAMKPTGMRALLPLFSHKHYVVVESLGSAKKGKGVLDNVEAMAKLDPTFKCSGIALYVASNWLTEGYDDAVKTFTTWCKAAKDRRIPVYFFWTPVTGRADGASYRRALDTPRAGGVPLWVHFAKATGAAGVAIDFPSEHWLSGPSSPVTTNGFKDLAVQICKDVKRAGLKFVWALNGTTQTLRNVSLFALDLAAKGVRPDTWWVDHFNPMTKDSPGTPETAPTPSGIAAVLIRDKL